MREEDQQSADAIANAPLVLHQISVWTECQTSLGNRKTTRLPAGLVGRQPRRHFPGEREFLNVPHAVERRPRSRPEVLCLVIVRPQKISTAKNSPVGEVPQGTNRRALRGIDRRPSGSHPQGNARKLEITGTASSEPARHSVVLVTFLPILPCVIPE